MVRHHGTLRLVPFFVTYMGILPMTSALPSPPSFHYPPFMTRLALPILTLAGILLLSGWILASAPGLDQNPKSAEQLRPRPSLLQQVRIQQMKDNEIALWMEAATATFDFDAGKVNYDAVKGSVDDPVYGRTNFSADHGVSQMKEIGSDLLTQLRFEDVLLYDNVTTSGGLIPAGQHGSLKFDLITGNLVAGGGSEGAGMLSGPDNSDESTFKEEKNNANN